MGVRLLSPTGRRIIDRDDISQEGAAQLRGKLGWTEYTGPGQVTAGHDELGTASVFAELGHKPLDHMSGANHTGTRNGWYIPGTDPEVDKILVPVRVRVVSTE